MAKNGMDRRTFLKMGGLLAAAGVTVPAASQVFAPAGMASSGDTEAVSSDVQWAMVVDLDKCTGCKVCEDVCADENNLPRYSGDQAKFDAYWMRIIEVEQEIEGVETEQMPMPVPCMHCEDPPCTHVCPTKASFRRDDGIVLVDEHRCIGCRYCVIACPYRVRYMVFKDTPDDQWTNKQVPKLMRGVASKCNFCVHLVDKGELPRCVVDCPYDALTFGDRNDSHSEVAEQLSTGKAQVLRPNIMVGPHVYYLGL